jgi:exonuclease VII small subunit
MSADDALSRAEDLLARLEAAREKLEATEDPDAAIEVLQELAELAKAIEAELQRARTDVEAQSGPEPDASDA